ncbi:MAG: DNA-binding protein [Chloroflexales bacterium]|nr:DNA-binding protein [Chloroflexales bacterium]
MQFKPISWRGNRSLVAIFDKDEELLAGLQQLAEEQNLTAASFTGVGAFSRVVLGFFDRTTMAYKHIPIDEQVEVLSLTGNIALSDGKPKAHPHVVVGKADGSAWGGHLLEAHVWPTLEIIISEAPGTLQRHIDPETGLALLELEVKE